MKAALLSALCTLVLAAPGWCQVHLDSSDVPSAEQAKAEVFGGFSLADGGVIGTGYGFNGGADFRMGHHFFVVIDVSQFSDPSQPSNTMSDTAFLFGPRYLTRIHPGSRASVFGEFLAGGDTFHNGGQAYTYRFNNSKDFAFAAEGGVDYAWNRHMSTRVTGGYLYGRLHNSTYGGPANPSYTANNRGRFAVDFVYRF
jgi:hypothetical protein